MGPSASRRRPRILAWPHRCLLLTVPCSLAHRPPVLTHTHSTTPLPPPRPPQAAQAHQILRSVGPQNGPRPPCPQEGAARPRLLYASLLHHAARILTVRWETAARMHWLREPSAVHQRFLPSSLSLLFAFLLLPRVLACRRSTPRATLAGSSTCNSAHLWSSTSTSRPHSSPSAARSSATLTLERSLATRKGR